MLLTLENIMRKQNPTPLIANLHGATLRVRIIRRSDNAIEVDAEMSTDQWQRCILWNDGALIWFVRGRECVMSGGPWREQGAR